MSGACASGTQRSGLKPICVPVKPAGATPTMVKKRAVEANRLADDGGVRAEALRATPHGSSTTTGGIAGPPSASLKSRPRVPAPTPSASK